MPLTAAQPALAVSHVIPGVRRDARAGEALVEAFEPTEMLVDAVRPHHHGDGGGALVGEPRLGVYRRAIVGDARERPFHGLHHSLPRGRGCDDDVDAATAPDAIFQTTARRARRWETSNDDDAHSWVKGTR